MLRHPIEAIKIFEDLLNAKMKEFQGNANPKVQQEKLRTDDQFPKKVMTYHVNFEGNFGRN